MTSLFAKRLSLWLGPAALGFGLLGASPALAQQAADSASSSAAEKTKKLPPYHGTFFFWEHNVSAETVGVGNDVQSSNPTYTMGAGAKARWYLLDDPGNRLSIRADAALYREFTNSDSTTRRGELTASDAELSLSYSRLVRGAAETDGTLLELRPLMLTFPTSRASLNSGRYFAAGALVGVSQVNPLLAGRFEPELGSALSFAVSYERWFARATVPTSPSLELVRMTSDGRSVPTDQLSGSSLIRDQLSVIGRWALSIGKSVSVTTDFGFQPAWKYDLPEDVELCGVVATGCTTVTVSENDSRYLARTLFNVELGVELVKSLAFAAGYSNVGNQLGPDGRRRGMFYSPDAAFYAALAFTPDELVREPSASSKQKQSAGSAGQPSSL